MDFHRVITGVRRLVYDFVCLFKPNTIYVYGFLTRKGIGFANFNWGDDINIRMLEDISDLKVLIYNRSLVFPRLARKVFCCIGSILGDCYGKQLEIWGSGFRSESERIKVLPQKVHSVRGPQTRRKLLEQGIDCPAVYGDPALLVSRYYHPRTAKKYKYGIIPHYIDESNPLIQAVGKRDDVRIISMAGYQHWHDIPDAVCSCEMIISSSLHGIIVSDSYGVPNAWARFSDQIVGGNFKYVDYFQSVDRDIREPIEITGIDDFNALFDNPSLFECAKSIDFEAIFEACPFKNHLKKW